MDMGVGAFVLCSALTGDAREPHRRARSAAVLLALGEPDSTLASTRSLSWA